jgi:hypothetical protein
VTPDFFESARDALKAIAGAELRKRTKKKR